MNQPDVIVGIGGAAGDGVASAGNTLAVSVARQGQAVFAYNSYQSGIVKLTKTRLTNPQEIVVGRRCEHNKLCATSEIVGQLDNARLAVCHDRDA